MTRWTKDNSDLLRYREEIMAGKIIAGQELRMELDNLAEDIATEAYRYDTRDARLRMDFIEGACKLTKSPFYGKPMVLLLWQRAFIEALYSFKMPDGFDRFRKALLLVARKQGKALALDTRIPTPEGDRIMADIMPGDYVFDEHGKPVRVLATSGIFRDHACYRVTFEDGEEIIADAGHRWSVYTKGARRVSEYTPKTGRKRNAYNSLRPDGSQIKTTAELIKDFARVRSDGKGIEYKYRVALPEPVDYPEKDLFSPYVLGLWLGDGNSHDNRITTADDDLPELIKQIQAEGVNVDNVRRYTSTTCEVRFGRRIGYHRHDVREAFRAMDLWKNKHIPEEYFTASIAQRWALLQGIMDTDGTCTKAGECEFTQKSPVLSRDVSRLLSSLGIKHSVNEKTARCSGKDCGIVYHIIFYVDRAHSCFRYERKKERLKETLAPRMGYKSIINVERVDTVPTKCIKVNSLTGLFLCGQRNTVTHNSETCAALSNAEFICGPDGADLVCSSNDDAQASIIYDAIDAMRQMYDPESYDTKRNQRFILNKATATRIFKISDRTRNKEGRNIDFAILDEVHEMQTNVIAKSIEQSQSLKDNPKLIEITTEGFVVDGYLDAELKRARDIITGRADGPADARFLPWLYTQDSEQEVFTNPASWAKSNPSLVTIKPRAYLEEQVDLAKRSKADRIFVLSKDFNIKQNGTEAWLNATDYVYDATFDPEILRGCAILGHVDLAETTDLCCAMALAMRPGDPTKYILSRYFVPASKLEPENDDHQAGAHYADWARAGLLEVTEGNDIDLTVVADWYAWLLKTYGLRLYRCGYDQRFARDWINQMEGYGWTRSDGDLEMVQQNAPTLNNAILLCEADFRARLINYDSNPITRWCLSNACLKLNDQRQALIVKTENNKKIDGAVALASLYEIFRRYRSDLRKMTGG